MFAGCLQAKAEGPDDISALQYLLLWSGDFLGPVDGERSPQLNQSLRSFQKRASIRPTDRPDSLQLKRLASDAQKRAGALNYALVVDKAAQVLVGLPKRHLGEPLAGPDGAKYTGASGLTVTTHRLREPGTTLLRVYRTWTAQLEGKVLTQNAFRGDHFSLLWFEDNTLLAVRFQQVAGEVRGLSLALDRKTGADLEYLVHIMISDFDATATSANRELMRLPNAGVSSSDGKDDAGKGSNTDRRGTSSGSGFIVSDRGHVVTNAHVVRDCDGVTVGDKVARVITMDTRLDLALLLVPGSKGGPVAGFAEEAVRLGEDVAVFGFPLRSILADQLNMTTGNVSALAGLGGNPNHVQFTAPVQRGNSGGPLVDYSGRVIGVVTSKLDALGMATSLGGDLSQAINFAVKGELVAQFLKRNGVQPILFPQRPPLKRTELGDVGRTYSVAVACTRE